MTAALQSLPQPRKREFRLEEEYRYDRSGPVRWIISHALRYPIFPLIALAAAVLELLDHRLMWPELKRAGRQFVERERHWAASVAHYAPVYERLAAVPAAA